LAAVDVGILMISRELVRWEFVMPDVHTPEASNPRPERLEVLIAGAGVAGLEAALALRSSPRGAP
jgi:hypothetical protein